jgi:hypothetical protein
LRVFTAKFPFVGLTMATPRVRPAASPVAVITAS